MKVKLSLSCEASLIALECYENTISRDQPVNTTVITISTIPNRKRRRPPPPREMYRPRKQKQKQTTNQALPVRSNGGQHASPDFLNDSFELCYLVLQRSVLLGLGVVSTDDIKRQKTKDKTSSSAQENTTRERGGIRERWVDGSLIGTHDD
jgi:hypothetical protein